LAISDAGIEAHGFAPQSWVFMPAAEDVILTTGDVTIDPGVEAAAWESAQSADSADGYRAFLSQFPSGAFAEEAQSRLDAILAEPFRDQRLAEESLSLTRNQRRDIQRDLTILDYDTRGIDGIFGSGTRRALTNWQQVNGYPQTSYLTEEQINRLDAQAARRQAQLEAEAEARRAEAERLDRAYWDETGARGDETGYRTYLERHPDGVYSQLARDALAEIEAAKLATSEAAERDAWNRASNADIILAYRQYLTDFPQGQFVDQALTRIEEISADAAEADQNIEAENAENALNLNSLTLRLIEGRLAELGLDPGEVDGQIDDDTRRAIRVYQRDRDLEVTGYLSEAVLVRLLADSL
jgi:peptidoglycan hydrolase-like protein with peptidoglycan-binding domain